MRIPQFTRQQWTVFVTLAVTFAVFGVLGVLTSIRALTFIGMAVWVVMAGAVVTFVLGNRRRS